MNIVVFNRKLVCVYGTSKFELTLLTNNRVNAKLHLWNALYLTINWTKLVNYSAGFTIILIVPLWWSMYEHTMLM